ncbi:hypothetical protein GN956_G23727 [Arapaima gigas]
MGLVLFYHTDYREVPPAGMKAPLGINRTPCRPCRPPLFIPTWANTTGFDKDADAIVGSRSGACVFALLRPHSRVNTRVGSGADYGVFVRAENPQIQLNDRILSCCLP